jgi:hypothetical protein
MDWPSFLSGFATAMLIALVILESSNREVAVRLRAAGREAEDREVAEADFLTDTWLPDEPS